MNSIIQKECKKIVSEIDFSSLIDKKILITGASGLVGVYISSCLNAANKFTDVYCWVNNDIDPIFADIFANHNIIKGDITSEIFLKDVYDTYCKEKKFDIIIHAAGYAQPTKFLDDKLKTIKINTLSSIKLFDMLASDGQFVFLSSSEIYSGNEEEMLTEQSHGKTNPEHPRSAYIESKSCGEAICNAFVQTNDKLNIKIMRLSLTYGPGTKKNDLRVINMLIQKAINDKDIKLLDDGAAVRTYGYITDIIEMFWNMLLFGKETTYNLSGVTRASILDVANIIGKKLNKKVVITSNSGLKGNPKNVSLSIEKYMKEFKKNNFINLDEGLQKTIDWQKLLY